MKPNSLLIVALGLFSTATVFAATAPPEGPGIQAAADAREPQVLQSECKAVQPPPPMNFAAFARRGTRPQPTYARYRVTAIPGIIKGGAHWKVLWRVPGDDADGIIPTPDGGILIARNNDSDVVKLMPNGHHTVVYQDTDTGGALSQNKQGQLFVVERGLRASIWELAPEHKVLANRYMGGPPNGGLFYAAPNGSVTHYGTDLRTNGIVLSPDEKTLYVTNNGTLVAFDVQANGSLTNQHTVATLPGGGGDGATVDSQGNIYVTGFAGVRVISPDGQVLGTIPAPLNLITVAFSGKDRKTLFAVGEVRTNKPNFSIGIAGMFARMEVMSIPVESQGYEGRPK
jgi:gluconolactonase